MKVKRKVFAKYEGHSETNAIKCFPYILRKQV